MIKACIFDLDGVVVDTAKYHFQAWKRVADHLGFEFTESDNEQLKGLSRIDSLNKLISMSDIQVSDRYRSKLLLTKNSWYLELVEQMNESEILPGVKEFIEELKTARIKIAIGSASKNAVLILEKIQLLSTFEAVIDGLKVTKSKPDPEVFLKGAQILNVAPSQTIVFEDSVYGIEAANSGGFISIGIGNPQILSKAKLVIPGFNDFSLSKLQKELTLSLAS